MSPWSLVKRTAIADAHADPSHSYYDASICADWVGCDQDGMACAARGLA